MTSGTRLVDPLVLRRCLGEFATGVAVVTTWRADGTPHGITVNSFASVSLDPPLVLFSLDRRARSCAHFSAGRFVANILTEDQLDLARHFAGSPVPELALPWAQDNGSPVLAGCAAYITARLWAVHDGGDHLIHVGHVERIEARGGRPLVFHAGEFRSLGTRVGELGWDDTLGWATGSGWLG